jgi:hypothetical protein
MVEWYPHVLVISTLHPTGPASCRNVIEFYYPEEIALFEPEFVAAEQKAYHETALEDEEICVRMTEGRKALIEDGREEHGPTSRRWKTAWSTSTSSSSGRSAARLSAKAETKRAPLAPFFMAVTPDRASASPTFRMRGRGLLPPAGDGTALLGSFAARFRSAPAMLHRMALAFLGTELARVCAECADLAHQFAAPRHIGGGKAADLGTIHVELDAAREVVAIRFEKAGDGTVAGRLRGRVARVDARSIVFVGHVRPLQKALSLVGTARKVGSFA